MFEELDKIIHTFKLQWLLWVVVWVLGIVIALGFLAVVGGGVYMVAYEMLKNMGFQL